MIIVREYANVLKNAGTTIEECKYHLQREYLKQNEELFMY